MGITSNLLYLLLLYAVLDKEGKLSVCAGLLIAIGIIVCTSCCFNGFNNPCNRVVPPLSITNPFLFNNALI